MAFANSLDPDQDQQNFRPDLCPNRLTLWQCSLKKKIEKVNFKKNQ